MPSSARNEEPSRALAGLLALRASHLGTKDNRIASGMFGGVEGAVGGLDEFALELCVGVENGDADTDGEVLGRVRRAGIKARLLHGTAQALGNEHGAGLVGFRKYKYEFLAAIA